MNASVGYGHLCIRVPLAGQTTQEIRSNFLHPSESQYDGANFCYEHVQLLTSQSESHSIPILYVQAV